MGLMKLNRERILKLISIVGIFIVIIISFYVVITQSGINADETTPAPAAATKNYFTKRWVLWRGTLQDVNNYNKLAGSGGVMDQAHDLGYTGIMLSDASLNVLATLTPGSRYFTQMETIKTKAKNLGLDLIPNAFYQREWQSAYYSPLQDETEVIPIKDTHYLVNGNAATAVSNPPISIANGGFETPGASGTIASDWRTDAPGKVTFRDTSTFHSTDGAASGASIRMEDQTGIVSGTEGIAYQTLPLTPRRVYTLDFWLKTDAWSATGTTFVEVVGKNSNYSLYEYNYSSKSLKSPIQPTQGWTHYSINFSSLDYTEAKVIIGASTPKPTGRIWLDDVSIKESGLMGEMVVRDSVPITVTSTDGGTTYTAGSDYTVEADPNATPIYTSPIIKRENFVGTGRLLIPAGSRITNGQTVNVAWPFYPNVQSQSPGPNLCDGKLYPDLEDDAKRIAALFPDAPAISNDINEWRTKNWDPTCGDQTSGEYVAKVEQTIDGFIRKYAPGKQVATWAQDMLDPYIASKPISTNGFYISRGSSENAWVGLDPSTVIMHWAGRPYAIDKRTNQTEQLSSLLFWAGLDSVYNPTPYTMTQHEQIIGGWYDSAASWTEWEKSLQAAEAVGATGIDGVIYSSWIPNPVDGIGNDFTHLAEFKNQLVAAGRWGAPTPTPASTLVPEPTPTSTPTPVPDPIITLTPLPVITPTPTPTPTIIPTTVPPPTPELTPTPTPSDTPIASAPGNSGSSNRGGKKKTVSPSDISAPAMDTSLLGSISQGTVNVLDSVINLFSPTPATPPITPSTPQYAYITEDLTYRQRSNQVEILNEVLLFNGLSAPNSNYFNLTTRNSLRSFQRRHGISIRDTEYKQAITGPKTRDILNEYIPEIEDTKINPQNHIPAYLRYGQRGGGALALNRVFKELGYLKDGEQYVFNSRTRTALNQFQRANGLKRTTKMNVETLNKLKEKIGQ